MVKLNMTVTGDEGSITPKAIVYQRTPTPRYEHWPQSPSASHYKGDILTSNPNTVEKHQESIIAITKLDTPHSDSTVSSNSLCDPPDSSHDPDSGSKDPQDSSHDPDGGSCDKNKTLPVSDVHSSNSDQSHDSIHDSQDLNSQANS